jgi:entericidin A
MLRKFVVTVVAVSSVFALCACNTVKGVGRDIESVGEAGDKAI